jgi:hypothetical protein
MDHNILAASTCFSSSWARRARRICDIVVVLLRSPEDVRTESVTREDVVSFRFLAIEIE